MKNKTITGCTLVTPEGNFRVVDKYQRQGGETLYLCVCTKDGKTVNRVHPMAIKEIY